MYKTTRFYIVVRAYSDKLFLVQKDFTFAYLCKDVSTRKSYLESMKYYSNNRIRIQSLI